MKALKENRIGRFCVAGILLHQAPAAVVQILSGGIVVRAEWLGYRDQIDYVMYHDAFAPTEKFAQAPLYECTIKDLVGGKYHVEWKRIE